jgi:hypothetical protein
MLRGFSIFSSLEVLIVLLHGGAIGNVTIELLLLIRLSLPSSRLRRVNGIVQGHETLEFSKIIGSIAHFIFWFGGGTLIKSDERWISMVGEDRVSLKKAKLLKPTATLGRKAFRQCFLFYTTISY